MMILIRVWLLVSLSAGAPLNPKVDKEEDLVINEDANGEIVKGEDILHDGLDLVIGEDANGEIAKGEDILLDGFHSHNSQDDDRDERLVFNGGDVSVGEMSFSGDYANIKVASFIIEDILEDSNDHSPTIQDDSCNSLDDCYAPGKMCHQIADASCICKNKQCKFSSGCGTQGAFFFTPCDTCSTEDCEDEGACVIEGSRCISKEVDILMIKIEEFDENIRAIRELKKVMQTIEDELKTLPITQETREEKSFLAETDTKSPEERRLILHMKLTATKYLEGCSETDICEAYKIRIKRKGNCNI